MSGSSGYGDAVIKRHDDGRIEVISADEVIGISLELLAQSVGNGLVVDGAGLLWLAGDSRYRYRPVRFACDLHGLSPDEAIEGMRMLVCERVR